MLWAISGSRRSTGNSASSSNQIERFEDVYEELKPYARNLQVIKIQADGTGKILLLTKDKNLLLAETLKDGSIRIQTLVDARKYINTFNYQLCQDVVQLKASRCQLCRKGLSDLFRSCYCEKQEVDARHVAAVFRP